MKTEPNIKGCTAASLSEPADAPVVEHGLAALTGITEAKPCRRTCAAR